MTAILETRPLETTWIEICDLQQIPVSGGVNALVNDAQVAVFRTRDNRLFALSNFDPFSKANVMSRGILGSTKRDGRDVHKVASPILKHTFDLETGQSFDDPNVFLPVFAVKLEADRVFVGIR
jgi:NAD(P)H-dependent nitrite reductase small subunit